MKSGTTNTVLTLVLAVLLLGDVLFALQTILRTREFRSMTARVNFARTSLIQEQALFTECQEYGKTHPAIKPILESVLPKATNR